MGFLGDSAGKLINSALGNSDSAKIEKTDLESFLKKFSSVDHKFIDTIDPLQSFDVLFKFYPNTISKNDNKNSFLNTLTNIGKTAVSNLADNLTGGLASSILGGKNSSILDERKKYVDDNPNKNTFLEYVAKSNLLIGSENWLFETNQSFNPLELQLGPYIQNITVPNFKLPTDGKFGTVLGNDFQLPGDFVTTDSKNLQMTVLNTKASLHERIFYPWMREISLPFWSYDDQPYTTATIVIDFSKHADLKYVFSGCRPVGIDTLQPNQNQTGEIARKVTFLFDFMYVESDLKTIDSVKDKLLNTAGSLLGGASNMLKL